MKKSFAHDSFPFSFFGHLGASDPLFTRGHRDGAWDLFALDPAPEHAGHGKRAGTIPGQDEATVERVGDGPGLQAMTVMAPVEAGAPNVLQGAGGSGAGSAAGALAAIANTTPMTALATAGSMAPVADDPAQVPPMATVELLDPDDQDMFVNDLPIATRVDAQRPGTHVFEMRESTQWLGLVDENGAPLQTTVWGYGLPGKPSYPGPTIVAHEGTPITVYWKNKLPTDGHLLPVDRSLHLAEPVRKTLDDGYVPTVTHLHGGRTESASDGLPEAWFTQNHTETGPDYETRFYHYDNDQEAATLWYHDHALGLTRLNVYAGLAGFYLLRDQNELSLTRDPPGPEDPVLPGGKYEIEMAIQDRMFTADGQLYYPAFLGDPLAGGGMVEAPDGSGEGHGGHMGGEPPAGEPPNPTVQPEFFGDFLLVNGMAWPKLEVEPTEYRFRMLNGSDSRFYVLELSDPKVAVTLVGVDGGLLKNAITLMDGDGVQEAGERLVLAPGDRADLVFDFGKVGGQAVTLLNQGPAFEPFKGFDADGELAEEATPATGTSVGQVMQFHVGAGPGVDSATVVGGTLLNPDYHALPESEADHHRKLGLFEGADPYGRVQPLLGVAEATTDVNGNAVAFGPLDWFDPITEDPTLGSTEVWEIYNFTADAHPIHLHLVQFQVLGKSAIAFADRDEDGMPDDTTGDGTVVVGEGQDVLIGDAVPVDPELTGWQDTAWVAPNEVIRVIATFDRPGEYVWHCHILSHEDHEMMRPFEVVDPSALVA